MNKELHQEMVVSHDGAVISARRRFQPCLLTFCAAAPDFAGLAGNGALLASPAAACCLSSD
jgi:hypothetical protein